MGDLSDEGNGWLSVAYEGLAPWVEFFQIEYCYVRTKSVDVLWSGKVVMIIFL